MPRKLSPIRILPQKLPELPAPSVSAALRFGSPLGQTLELHDPMEFMPGAESWRCALLNPGSDARIALGDGRYALPFPFQPWSYDGKRLFLATWNHEIHSYLTSGEPLAPWKRRFQPISVLASPHSDRIFINHYVPPAKSQYLVTDLDGNIVRELAVPPTGEYFPYFFWSGRSGYDGPRRDRLFAVIRRQHNGPESLILLDPESGAILAETEFTPRVHCPYDERKFERVARNNWTLEASPGVFVSGDFLDRWYSLDYSHTENLLRATVLRPSGNVRFSKSELREVPVVKQTLLFKIEAGI